MVRSAFLLALLSLSLATTTDATELRRVLLISCDTLSAKHLGTWGYERPTASTLDSLASTGVSFRHCIVPQVWTLSSHMSLFTGLAPGVHRVGADDALPEAVPLLAERFAEAGFATGAFISSNAWLAPTFGFGRGFENYEISQRQTSLTEPVKAWVDSVSTASRSWFVFAHYMDVHSRSPVARYPYEPWKRDCWTFDPVEEGFSRRHYKPADSAENRRAKIRRWDFSKYDVDFLRRSYDDCVDCWDQRRLRPLLEELRTSGQLEETLIVITADHGEEFLEHGEYEHRSPHVEVREVPLIFVWPDQLAQGAVVQERVSLMDLAPTILDLAGLEPLIPGSGRSLVPLLKNPRARTGNRDFLVDGFHRGLRDLATGLVAETQGRWWLMTAEVDTAGTTGSFQPARAARVTGLYDLDADPGEEIDVQELHPAIVDELTERLLRELAIQAERAAQIFVAGSAPRSALTEEQRLKLQSLGY